jgi:hypothetical protein
MHCSSSLRRQLLPRTSACSSGTCLHAAGGMFRPRPARTRGLEQGGP